MFSCQYHGGKYHGIGGPCSECGYQAEEKSGPVKVLPDNYSKEAVEQVKQPKFCLHENMNQETGQCCKCEGFSFKEEIKASFRKELEALINRHSRENGSDTPDFILAEYLCECLQAFDKAAKHRDNWYGPRGRKFSSREELYKQRLRQHKERKHEEKEEDDIQARQQEG